MTLYELDMLRTIVQVVAFAIGGALGILWTVRTGFFSLQKRTVTTLQDTVTALEERVAQLEQKLFDYETRNSELEGMVEGKDKAIAELIAGVAESRLCVKAWSCPDHEPPIKPPKRRRLSDANFDPVGE